MRSAPAVPLVLVVEDDYGLRLVLNTSLEDEGFSLVMAATGAEAVDALNENAGRFSAVITDIRLGRGPSGWDVGRRARELVPAMPVIYTSGDSGHEWPIHGVPRSVMVQKPFAVAQLVAALSVLLNTAQTLL